MCESAPNFDPYRNGPKYLGDEEFLRKGSDHDRTPIVASKILQSRCCSSRLAPNRAAKVGRQFTARDSRAHHSRGTEGSNPAPSSGESRANLKDRLNRREGLVLVQAVAGNAALPDEIMTEVFERADGVPAVCRRADACGPLVSNSLFSVEGHLVRATFNG